MGLEELLRCLILIPAVKEEKLLAYLDAYGKQVMYQKTGYILEHFRDMWNLSDGFFSACESKIGKSKRYFYKPSVHQEIKYKSRWRIVIPTNLIGITSKGVSYDADV
jgi:hypothetical protein